MLERLCFLFELQLNSASFASSYILELDSEGGARLNGLPCLNSPTLFGECELLRLPVNLILQHLLFRLLLMFGKLKAFDGGESSGQLLQPDDQLLQQQAT